MQWINVEESLPNEDEIEWNSYVYDYINKPRAISDRILAIDENGFVRTGYFTKSGAKHNYYGKCKQTTKYIEFGCGRWSFGEHYNNDPKSWIVGDDDFVPIAWMPTPKKICKEEL